jgi:phosphatidylserine decarboxylase
MAEISKRIAATALRVLPRKGLSRALGAITRIQTPQAGVDRAIDIFVRAYDVDLSEAIRPEGGYSTFNEFFTRSLVASARPVDPSPDALVSPSDGSLEALGVIAGDSSFEIKGKPYTTAELLGSDSLAERFCGGVHATVYLSPRDYHRVHAPVTGRVLSAEYVAGTLYPVNTIGTDFVDGLFARNERVCVVQESETHGLVATILVGAIGVGRMSLAFDDLVTNAGQPATRRDYLGEGPVLRRGDELGVFNLGSTVILLVDGRCELDLEARVGTNVRMGERIATGRVS